jgi:hypothetical protein
MANFNLENYKTVQERVAEFYTDFPEGSIRTFMVVRDGPEVIFEARAYRTAEEAAIGVYTSGFAREVEGKSPVNKTSHVENAESSAVGRALANLGYATDAARPSRNEMLKVARMQEEHEEMLQFIRSVGPKVGDGVEVTLPGVGVVVLKEFTRENWGAIKEQFRLARAVVEAIEGEAGETMHAEQEVGA